MTKYKPIQVPLRKGKTALGDDYEIYEEFGFYTLYIKGKMCATRPNVAQLDKFLERITER